MDPSTTLATQTARTKALRLLRQTDPILWAICMGHASAYTIAQALAEPLDLVQTRLTAYHKAKLLKPGKYMGHPIYKLTSLEHQRLAKRARVVRFKNKKDHATSLPSS